LDDVQSGEKVDQGVFNNSYLVKVITIIVSLTLILDHVEVIRFIIICNNNKVCFIYWFNKKQ